MNHSHLLALTLGSTLAILTPALAQDAKLEAPLKVEVPAGEGLVAVEDLIKTWSRQTGRSAFVTPQAAALKIKLAVGGHTLTRAALMDLLNDHEVLLVESATRVRAMKHREAQVRINSAHAKVYTEDQALPSYNAPVTLVYQVKNGSGSALFANLRGLLSRDSLRLGNILYIRGPEQIVIFDLAPKVAYYREILRNLDKPDVKPSQRVLIYEVPDSTWSRLKVTPGRSAAAALAKLVSEGQATLHDEARVHGFRFSFSRELRDGKGRDFHLSLNVYDPDVDPKQPLTGPTRLSLSLSRSTEGGGQQNRRLLVEAPSPDVTTLVSAKLDSGEAPTHLVVVLSPTP